MCKEMEKLKSKIDFYKKIIYEIDILKYKYNTNKYDKIIEEYQNRITELYKRLQDLEEENK